MAKYKTSALAKAFRCHAKTILRAMLNEPAPSDWYDESFDDTAVAKTFGFPSVAALARVMRGDDTLVTTEEAAELKGISLRRFHQLQADGSGPVRACAHGRTVRYLESDLLDI